MDRLTREQQRLWGAAGPTDPLPRALLVEAGHTLPWAALGTVWQGVQAELGLPAPAIAVDGHTGLQLWFALAQAPDPAQAQTFLQGLRQRYLAAWPAARVGLHVAPAAERLPGARCGEERWSAFVAADLAPLFEETPWLDVAPGAEGQAELLARLACATPQAWAQACAALQPYTEAAPPAAGTVTPAAGDDRQQARAFLLQVMHDATAPLALRVEAAKALLA